MHTLTKMATFVAVVETGSFAAAARKVGITRSAVSRQVFALEETLATTLLVRTTRTSHLTEAGETYYQRCQEILQLAEQADAEARGGARTVSGTLRLVAPLLLHRILAPLVAEFLEAHPAVSIDLGFSDSSTRLVEEGIDLAIRVGPSEDSTLTAAKIAPVSYVLCASPGYLARHTTPKKPQELSAHRFITFTPLASANAWTFYKNRRAHTVRVRRVLATNASIALRDAALEGVGVTVIPSFYVEDDLAAGRLTRLLPSYEIPPSGIYGVYPRQQSLPARTRAFLDAAKRRLAADPRFDAKPRLGRS